MGPLWAFCFLVFFAASTANPVRDLDDSDDDHFPRLPDLPTTYGNADLVAVVLDNSTAEHELGLINNDVVGDALTDDEDGYIRGSEEDKESPDESILEGRHFEGDISGVSLRSASSDADQRNAVVNSYQKWERGEIPYVISSSFTRRQRAVIYAAMAEFERLSCVRWRPKSPQDTDYVHILADRGCYSRVGRTGGPQVLSLGRGCAYQGTAVHEMLHAAGFWHEQSRPDRDAFVSVAWHNIEPGREDNFAKYSSVHVSTLDLPYDPGSVMHYHSRAFSRNGRNTISPLNSGTKLGQRGGFSADDAAKLNKLYGCTATTLVPDPTCKDVYADGLCQSWKDKGGCRKYQTFMLDHCKRSCELCPLIEVPVSGDCRDKDKRCPKWATNSEDGGDDLCANNLNFMNATCPLSCGFCRTRAASVNRLDFAGAGTGFVGRGSGGGGGNGGAAVTASSATMPAVLTFAFLLTRRRNDCC